jgi:outer membrane receptor for ferrienterochelin and colicins
MKETFIKDSPVKVEEITQKFLQTNPTNNGMEALQTVNGVQEQVNEWKFAPKSSLLMGARPDLHQKHGLIFAPRVNLKQKLGDFTTARLNLGTGFRVVNLFTKDHAALTGARTVLIQNDLQPEESYNAALDINRAYTMGESAGSVDVDVFYTYFTNKIIPDYDTDPNLIIYDNLDGHSISRGMALNVQHSFSFH